jgi:lipoprotein-anchoring transpeptidase ErfK/SrfK
VRFNTSIKRKYRAEVERHMTVTSKPAVVGSWHWIDGERLRYRPMKYWPAGTEVKLRIDLENLKTGDRVYGGESRTIRFTIGRSMVSKVNVKTHTMSVYLDGALARTIPVSTGKKGFETRGGVKVVLSKEERKIMDGATIGIKKDDPEYYRLEIFWAVRVTYSGEFVHAAEHSRRSHGRANVSHGCVGMSMEAAKWVFENSIRGDVVEVEGNRNKLMELDNGFGDWNIPWKTWKAGSALN